MLGAALPLGFSPICSANPLPPDVMPTALGPLPRIPEAFSEMIVIQKASLKTRLEEQVMEQNQAIDKFIARWHALRPTELEHWDIKSVNKAVAELNESNLLCPFQVAHQVDYIGGRPS